MSLILTTSQELRSAYAGQADKYERRDSKYSVLNLFKRETDKAGGIISASLKEQAAKSFGNAGGVFAPVIDGESVTIGTSTSCIVADSENTSNLYQITFIPYSFGFTTTPAQHWNNEIGLNEDFAVKAKKYLLQMAADMDLQAATILDNAKNQFFPPEMLAYYTEVGDAFQVPLADQEDLFNQMQSISQEQDFYDTTEVVTNPKSMAAVRRNFNQGTSNSINEKFQFEGFDFNSSNRVVNGALKLGTYYTVNEGSLGLLNRNTPESIMGSTSSDGTEWGIAANLPFINMDMGVKTSSTCADKSALASGASTASLVQTFQYFTEVAYVTPYNSDAAGTYSAITKYEVIA